MERSDWMALAIGVAIGAGIAYFKLKGAPQG